MPVTLDQLQYQIEANTQQLQTAIGAIQALVNSLSQLDRSVNAMGANFQAQMARVSSSTTQAANNTVKSAQAMQNALARQQNTVTAAESAMIKLNQAIARAGGNAQLVNQTSNAFSNLQRQLTGTVHSATDVRAITLQYSRALDQVRSDLRNHVSSQNAAQQAIRATDAALIRQSNTLEHLRNKYLDLRTVLVSGRSDPAKVKDLDASFKALEQRLTSGVMKAKDYSAAQNAFKGKLAEVKRTSDITSPALQKLLERIDDLTSSVQFALGPLSGVASRISAFSTLAHRNSVVMAGIIGGVIAFGSAMGLAVLEGVEFEQQMLGIQAMLNATGLASKVSSKDIERLVNELEKLMSVSDRQLREAIVPLINIHQPDFETLREGLIAAQGISLSARGDIVTNARRMAKALDDPINGINELSEAGIKFNAIEREAITLLQLSGNLAGAREKIYERLEALTAAATAETRGLTGALSNLGKDLRNIAEDSARSGGLITILTGIIKTLDQALVNLNNNYALTTRLGLAFANTAQILASTLTFVVTNFRAITAAIIALLALRLFNFLAVSIGNFAKLGMILTTVIGKITTLALSLLLLRSPLGLIGTAIAGLAGYLVYANWDRFGPAISRGLGMVGLSADESEQKLEFLTTRIEDLKKLLATGLDIPIGIKINELEAELGEVERRVALFRKTKQGDLFDRMVFRIFGGDESLQDLENTSQLIRDIIRDLKTRTAIEIDTSQAMEATEELNKLAKAYSVAIGQGQALDLSGFDKFFEQVKKTGKLDVGNIIALKGLQEIRNAEQPLERLALLKDHLVSEPFRMLLKIDNSAAEELIRDITALEGEEFKLRLRVGTGLNLDDVNRMLNEAFKSADFSQATEAIKAQAAPIRATGKALKEVDFNANEVGNAFIEYRNKIVPVIDEQNQASASLQKFVNLLPKMREYVRLISDTEPELGKRFARDLAALEKTVPRIATPLLQANFEIEKQIELAREQASVVGKSARDQTIALAMLRKEHELLSRGITDDFPDYEKLKAKAGELEAINFGNQFKQQTLDLGLVVAGLEKEVELGMLADADRESIVGHYQDQLQVQREIGDLNSDDARQRLMLLDLQREYNKLVQNQSEIRNLADELKLQQTTLRTMFLSEGTRSRQMALAEKMLELEQRYGKEASGVAAVLKQQELSLFKQTQANEVLIEQVQALKDAYDSVFSSIENAFVEFVRTGKLSLRDLENEILGNVFQITFKASIIDPLKDMIGRWLGNLMPDLGVANPLAELGTLGNPMHVVVDNVGAVTAQSGGTGVWNWLSQWFGTAPPSQVPSQAPAVAQQAFPGGAQPTLPDLTIPPYLPSAKAMAITPLASTEMRGVGGGVSEALKFIMTRGKGLEAGGINPEFAQRLQMAVQEAEQATGSTARFTELYRSPSRQAQYFANFLRKPISFGGKTYFPRGIGGLAAPPGRSRHQFGQAADIARGPVLDYLHANKKEIGRKYGLEFLKGRSFKIDPVHIQMKRNWKGQLSEMNENDRLDNALPQPPIPVPRPKPPEIAGFDDLIPRPRIKPPEIANLARVIPVPRQKPPFGFEHIAATNLMPVKADTIELPKLPKLEVVSPKIEAPEIELFAAARPPLTQYPAYEYEMRLPVQERVTPTAPATVTQGSMARDFGLADLLSIGNAQIKTDMPAEAFERAGIIDGTGLEEIKTALDRLQSGLTVTGMNKGDFGIPAGGPNDFTSMFGNLKGDFKGNFDELFDEMTQTVNDAVSKTSEVFSTIPGQMEILNGDLDTGFDQFKILLEKGDFQGKIGDALDSTSSSITDSLNNITEVFQQVPQQLGDVSSAISKVVKITTTAASAPSATPSLTAVKSSNQVAMQPVGTIEQYNSTFRERAVDWLNRNLFDDTRSGREKAEHLISIGELSPFGAATSSYDVGRGIGSGNLLGAGLASMGVLGLPARGPIKAFHASRYKFDRFDMRKIGTGEGNQAYGKGLYFAQNPNVMNDYYHRFGRSKWMNTEGYLDYNDPDAIASQAMDRFKGNRQLALEHLAMKNNSLEFELERLNKPAFTQKYNEQRIAGFSSVQAKLTNTNEAMRMLETNVPLSRTGFEGAHRYEVQLNVEPEDLIKSDFPLRDQSNIYERLRSDLKNRGLVGDDEILGQTFGYEISPQTFNELGKYRRMGIPGLSYLDQGSRNRFAKMTDVERQLKQMRNIPEKQLIELDRIRMKQLQQQMDSMKTGPSAKPLTSNFVMFDDKLIDIVRRYGIAGGTLTAGAAAAGLTGDKASAATVVSDQLTNIFDKGDFKGNLDDIFNRTAMTVADAMNKTTEVFAEMPRQMNELSGSMTQAANTTTIFKDSVSHFGNVTDDIDAVLSKAGENLTTIRKQAVDQVFTEQQPLGLTTYYPASDELRFEHDPLMAGLMQQFPMQPMWPPSMQPVWQPFTQPLFTQPPPLMTNYPPPGQLGFEFDPFMQGIMGQTQFGSLVPPTPGLGGQLGMTGFTGADAFTMTPGMGVGGTDLTASMSSLSETINSQVIPSFEGLADIDFDATFQNLTASTESASSSLGQLGPQVSSSLGPIQQSAAAIGSAQTQAGAQIQAGASNAAAGSQQLGTAAGQAAPQVGQLGTAASVSSTKMATGGGGGGGFGGLAPGLMQGLGSLMGFGMMIFSIISMFAGEKESRYEKDDKLEKKFTKRLKEGLFGIETILPHTDDWPASKKARKMHTGGTAGIDGMSVGLPEQMRPNELLTLLEKDEQVLTKQQWGELSALAAVGKLSDNGKQKMYNTIGTTNDNGKSFANYFSKLDNRSFDMWRIFSNDFKGEKTGMGDGKGMYSPLIGEKTGMSDGKDMYLSFMGGTPDYMPRYHNGLMPDEFYAILRDGEGVFTKEQITSLGKMINKRSEKGGERNFYVTIQTPNPESFKNSRGQIEAMLAKATQRGTRNL